MAKIIVYRHENKFSLEGILTLPSGKASFESIYKYISSFFFFYSI